MFPAVPYSRYVIGSLPWYTFLIFLGIVAALTLASREEKRLSLPQDTVIDLAFFVIPFGIIGARLYYVAFQWPMFADDPLAILRIWEGGLAIYGSMIGGALAILLFCKWRKLSPLRITDMIAPGLALAQSIGRWGNYFNMEAYGTAITDPAWQFFPAGVLIPSADGTYVWHMATFFYESMWNLGVFLALWFVIRKRTQRHGTVTLWYFLLYGIGRFLIEGLRTDSLMSGNIRVSQMLSLALAAASVVLLLVRYVRNRKSSPEVS